jgi:hypothetical protein
VVSTLGLHVRAMRWKALLAPIRPDIAFEPRIAGTAAGFALNNLLPARVGEFARALVCARVGRIKVGSVFGTLVVERVLDAIVCIVLLFGVIAFEGFPGNSEGVALAQRAARGVAVLAAVLGTGLIVLAAFPERSLRVADAIAERILPAGIRRHVLDALHAFVSGLGALRDPWLLAQSLAWVVFQWLFLGISFYLAFMAFGIDEPGFWGPFELASKYGLDLWGVDESRSVAFALSFHVGGWLSVTAVGLYYIAKLRLSWSELRGSAERVEAEVEADPEIAPPKPGLGRA